MTLRAAIPGTATYRGRHGGDDARYEHLRYNAQELVDAPAVVAPAAAAMSEVPLPVEGQVNWYDWRGLGDSEGAVAFAKNLGMPALLTEDALDVEQRPKFEQRAASRFVVVPHLSLDEDGELLREHVTIYWTSALVISMQEFPDDLFAGIRERAHAYSGRLRERGTGYLAYALTDAIVDGYADVLTAVEVAADALEDDILNGRSLNSAKVRVHDLKRTVNGLRRVLLPLRDAIGRWQRADPLVAADPASEPDLSAFLRDLSDNVNRAYDLAETYGMRASDLYQLYTSELALRTNDVVQLLTVVSAIFIPLTFLAGIYGMNFDYIPELHTRYGYFVLLGLMAITAVVLLGVFKRKGWL